MDVMASNIPEVNSLGTEYIVPKIISDDDSPAGYAVSVVATEDDTTVESDSETRSLNQGESAIFEYELVNRSIFVNCSKPCLVVQYAKSIKDKYSKFMHHILPETEFYTSAYFITLDAYRTSYLNLVVTGESPADLLLNGTALDDLTWTPNNGYTTAELPIPQGAYQLDSRDGRPFNAYVYLHMMRGGAGAGYTLLPMESTKVTPEPISWIPTTPVQTTSIPTTTVPTTSIPTPPPPVNSSLPRHTARVNGAAFTEDGLPMTPQCAVAYLGSLEQSAHSMVGEVNQAIGQHICIQAEDIVVEERRTVMFHQGNETVMEIEHTLRAQGHHVVSEVESCAVEVAEYLNDHSNWPQPILPPQPGCSRLQFQVAYFNTSGTYWNCDNQLEEDEDLYLSNDLSYKSQVSEVLTTETGSDLDADCTRSYSEEASMKANTMMSAISAALVSSGCSDIVRSLTKENHFTALGNQTYCLVSYFYVAGPSTTFDEFLTCMQLVHEFSLEHDNWSPGNQPGDPFLPVPPGCPALEHDGPTLDDEGRSWICF